MTDAKTNTIYRHLFEIRRRLIQTFLLFALFFAIFFYAANPVFMWLVSPLINLLPQANSIIATKITASFLMPVYIAFDMALLFVVPFALMQLWRFIIPGLFTHERRLLAQVIVLSSALFILGVLFCFYVVLPFLLQFFVNAVPENVKLMPDIIDIVGFLTRMLLLFGLCFEVPLVCVFLVRLGVLSLSQLQKFRPYYIVSAFIIGMLLTPPDVLSQLVLALPLCILYELGLIFVKITTSSRLQLN